MEEIEAWLARDRNSNIFIYENQPIKVKREGYWALGFPCISLPKGWFPEVRWQDKDPTKVTLTIKK